MPRVRIASDGFIIWHCPGCGHGHGIPVTQEAEPAPKTWNWNGDVEAPTVSPSILVNVGHSNPNVDLCHCFVRDGKIQFLADCTHVLAGRTVEMENADE